MKNDTLNTVAWQEDVLLPLKSEELDGFGADFHLAFDQIVGNLAQKVLCEALQMEAECFLERYKNYKDEKGRRNVVRNGVGKVRKVTSRHGSFPVQTPRVHDRSGEVKFTSNILPPYMRRFPQCDDLVALLYINGVSTNKMQEVMEGVLGNSVSGFSDSQVTRLIQVIEQEYDDWCVRSLADKNYIYLWADGVYFDIRGEADKLCTLVMMGVTEEGHKEILSITDGTRESTLSWKEVLLDLKSRGMTTPPKLAIGDGSLGFWNALREVFPTTKQQRCWVHKIRNVLNKLPDSVQKNAKDLLNKMVAADHEKEALRHYETFIRLYQDKHPKAVECLIKDKNHLFNFYSFPAAHWQSIRTTNPIESVFATLKRRTHSTQGRCTRKATLAMIYKLSQAAQRNWRKLNKYPMLLKIVGGIIFKDGLEMTNSNKAA